MNATGPFAPSGGSRRWLAVSLAAAALGAVMLAAGAALDPARAAHAYLAAYAFALSVTLGALVLLAVVHAIGATWPVAIRRIVESVVAVMPLLAVLLLPVLAGMKLLYPWLRPESFANAHARELVVHRLAWLDPPFFVARAVVVMAVWTAIALLLRRWSLAQDTDASPDLKARMRRLGAASLPVLGITMTAAAFDWLMSLTPEWFTAMYGVYFFAGGFVAAIALVTVAADRTERSLALPALRPSHYYALGRLLLAFTIFWAYIAYFQFFLVWIGNRPTEATWYLARMGPGWRGVSAALAVTRFAVPFLVLLPYAVKWRRVPLVLVAVWIVASNYLDFYWLVLPSALPTPGFGLSELGALLLLTGGPLAYAIRAASRHPLVARGDPQLAEALAYDSR